MRGDSGGDRATGRDGGGRAAARATSASLCCPSTRARAAACIEAELMQPWRRASRLRGRSAALEPSIVHKPVPLKHESKSGIMYRSRADEAAAACVTPLCTSRALSASLCRPSTRTRAAACFEAKPTKQRGKRHACEGDQLRTSQAVSASLCCSCTRTRSEACIEAK